MTDGEPTHDELVEQATAVLEATRATMYYPVAHAEAAQLQAMLRAKTTHHDTDDRRKP